MGELERHQHSGTRQEWMGGYIRPKFDRHRYARHRSNNHDFARKVSAGCGHLGTSSCELIRHRSQMVDCGCFRAFENSDSEREWQREHSRNRVLSRLTSFLIANELKKEYLMGGGGREICFFNSERGQLVRVSCPRLRKVVNAA